MALGYLPLQIEPGSSQQLHTAVVDARGDAKAVELDLMEPLGP